MVSIRQLEKKNQLSAELKKHGFAVDFSQAFEQADRIYSNDKKSPEVAFADEQQVLVMEPKAENDLQELKDRIRVLERQKENAQRRAEEHKQTLGEVTSKVNEIIKSINLMEKNQQAFSRKISELKKSGVEDKGDDTQSDPQESSDDPPQGPQNKGEGAQPNEQEYSPQDVAVEKIFYSGQ